MLFVLVLALRHVQSATPKRAKHLVFFPPRAVDYFSPVESAKAPKILQRRPDVTNVLGQLSAEFVPFA